MIAGIAFACVGGYLFANPSPSERLPIAIAALAVFLIASALAFVDRE